MYSPMKRNLLAMLLLVLGATGAAAQDAVVHWGSSDVAALKRWVDSAPLDALPKLSTSSLDLVLAKGKQQQIDDEATMLALALARAHLLGTAPGAERKDWHIVDSDADIALEPLLEKAVAEDTLDTFFAMLRPRHEEYGALRAAFATENEANRRKAIARNMERWRWMPHSLGSDYVLVNVARFEAALWRNGAQVGSWKVIVGKPATPTPSFNASIEGVIFNPWWEIPASIVRESLGALVRRNPTLARQRGYVWGGGQYRQRPGPNNALGQMKLMMPNAFSVYMHDTPNKQLFDEEVRTFSHGCIRTKDAIGYAATLLGGARSREEIDGILASGKTTTVMLDRPIPVFVAYFTAVSDGRGGITIAPDIYERDGRIRSSGAELSMGPMAQAYVPKMAYPGSGGTNLSCPLPVDFDGLN